jgi:uncharacterized membrane protein
MNSYRTTAGDIKSVNQDNKSETLVHRVFVLTILGKGFLGLVQLATAAAVYLGVTDRLPALARSLVAAELAEDPNDFLAARILSLASKLPDTDATFYAIYFSAHGMLHVAVVLALLFGSAWAYPSAIVVLCAFIVYQILEWMSVGGLMLLVLSAIDLLVIYLTLLEWRHLRQR